MVAVGPAILLSAAAEALALTILIPDRLPPNPLVWTLIRTFGLNVLLYIIYKCVLWPFFLTPLRHLPHPSMGTPIMGQARAMFEKPPGQRFLKWMRELPNDGLIYFRAIFQQDRLLVTNPKILGELLVTKTYDFEKPKPARNFLRLILGDGLIIVEGDLHKFQRKHIMPVFGFRHLKGMYPMMYKKAQVMVQGMTDEVQENKGTEDHSVVEINHWANKVTMDIIGVAGLGREFNSLRNNDDELIQNYEGLLEPTREKLVFFVLSMLIPRRIMSLIPWRINKQFKEFTSNLNRITIDLVRAKQQKVKKGGEEGLDILSVLIKSDNFNDAELRDQMLTFLAAGHETTSSTFTWTSYLLGKHQDIQDRLRDEVNEAVPRPIPEDFDYAAVLESLPLLNAVCNETLRLYPTVPMTIREAVRPTTLGDQFIPQGTQIILSPWAINHSPDLWGPNADEFVPERWINPDGKPNNAGGAPSAYAILTFLHGPRSCIGANFAKAELRCIVAEFVTSFHIKLAKPDENVIPAGAVTTKPKDGMHLKLTPIKK